MFEAKLGEIAALGCAICWTVCALAFESAGRKIGSLSVNYIRLFIGMIFLCIYTFIFRGFVFPSDATAHAWIWLFVSGLIGFAIGDLLLFYAFTIIGARISMLIMASVPPITAIIGLFFLHESMTLIEVTGMVLTVSGISLVILRRDSGKKRVKFSHPIRGVLFAFGGAVGQALGLILSKYGIKSYDAFAATQIRIVGGIFGFTLIILFFNKWKNVGKALVHSAAMKRITLGSFFGPFLGVALSLLAVQYTKAGIASTIMAIVPLLIIPPAIIYFKEKVTAKELLGAVVAVGGVSLLFL